MTVLDYYSKLDSRKQWLHITKQWIQGIIGRKIEQYYTPLVMRQLPGKGCKLLLLERNTPGAVSTWRFNCELLQRQYMLITLDNLADLDRYFQRSNRQKKPGNTKREIVNLPISNVSHRIGISLIDPFKNQEWIGVWDLNLIDDWSTYHAEDYKAEQLVLYLGRRLISSYEFMPDFFEQQIIEKRWWQQRIMTLCKADFTKDHDVNLTPLSETKPLSGTKHRSNLIEFRRKVG